MNVMEQVLTNSKSRLSFYFWVSNVAHRLLLSAIIQWLERVFTTPPMILAAGREPSHTSQDHNGSCFLVVTRSMSLPVKTGTANFLMLHLTCISMLFKWHLSLPSLSLLRMERTPNHSEFAITTRSNPDTKSKHKIA